MTAFVAQWESGRLKLFRLRFDSSHRHFLGLRGLGSKAKGFLLIGKVVEAKEKGRLAFWVFWEGLLENYIIGILSAEEIWQSPRFPIIISARVKYWSADVIRGVVKQAFALVWTGEDIYRCWGNIDAISEQIYSKYNKRFNKCLWDLSSAWKELHHPFLKDERFLSDTHWMEGFIKSKWNG